MSGKRKSQTVYRIGEAARVLALKTCVLRFWEGEFPQLAPVRTPKGQRLYTEEDMAVLRRIRSLLHEQGMTIEGAKRVLAGEMIAPAEGAKRVLAGKRVVPAEGTRRVPTDEMSLPAENAFPRHEPPDLPEQGSLMGEGPADTGTSSPGPADPVPHAVLADALAELESLRGLLRTTPTPLDSPVSPISLPSPDTPSQGRSA